MRLVSIVCCLAIVATSNVDVTQPTPAARADPMTTIAERYVKLVLALGQHDADYVDAYYGPAEWKKEAESNKIPLDDIAASAQSLLRDLGGTPSGGDEMERLRHQYIDKQLSALAARVRMLKGERLSFDEESKALYDAVAPTYPESHFKAILDKLEKRFPGTGSLVERYDTFRRQFVIPPDRLDTVFKTAIKGCRDRTLQHITLPATESFTIEYVKNKTWSG